MCETLADTAVTDVELGQAIVLMLGTWIQDIVRIRSELAGKYFEIL